MFVILDAAPMLFINLHSLVITVFIAAISFESSSISNMPQNILPKFANMPMQTSRMKGPIN